MPSKLFSVHPRWLLRATIILVIALFSLMATSTEGSLVNVVPQATGSPFDFIDGNLMDEYGHDWESLHIAGEVTLADDPASGQQDDAFGKGAKEDEPEPAIVTGSIPKNKSDLLRFYVADERVEYVVGEQVVAHHFLYLAWVRDNTLGTANMDFELNRNICDPAKPEDSICSSNGITPERLLNDMLVTFDMGSEIQLGLSRWIETGQCESAASAPCWSPIIDLAGSGYAVGAVNEVSVLDPIAGTTAEPLTLQPLTFGEAAINLTLAEVFDPNICTNLGSAYLKSRSSNSFTASLKDFIAPQSVSVSNCGNIIVQAETRPGDNPPLMDFTLTGGPGPDPVDLTFTLNSLTLGSIYDVSLNGGAVLAGSGYEIGYPELAGWDLDLARSSCDDGSAVNDIDVSPEETVTCTFYYIQRGHIIVNKTAVGGDATFRFVTSGDNYLGFNLPGGDSNDQELAPGTYSVTELHTTGWDLTDLTCDSTRIIGATANIELDPGERVTCTFTNAKRGHIIIDKVTVPSADPQFFDFSLTGGPDSINQTPSLADATTPHDSGAQKPGTYSASETVPAGWDLTSATCNDGSAPGSIDLDAGETVTCTFTNTKRGTIIVEKQTIGGDGNFSFSGAAAGTISNGGQIVVLNLVPNASYTVTETDPMPYFDLTAITCDDNSSATPSSWDVPARTATFEVDPGEEVKCTFTNTKQLFTIITLVCLDNQLYASQVVMDGVVGDSKISLDLGATPAGLDDADLCGLGGASYAGKDHGPHTVSVDIPSAR